LKGENGVATSLKIYNTNPPIEFYIGIETVDVGLGVVNLETE
jgi:hypothetical protein